MASSQDEWHLPKNDRKTVERHRKRKCKSEYLDSLNDIDAAERSHYRKECRKRIANAFSYAIMLDENPDEWRKFCEDPFWFTNPPDAKEDKGEILRWVLKRVSGKSDRASDQNTSKQFRALSAAWAERVCPSKIFSYINESGGIAKLASKNAVAKKAPLPWENEPDAELTEKPKTESKKPIVITSSKVLKKRTFVEGSKVTLSATVVQSRIGRLELRVTALKERKPKA